MKKKDAGEEKHKEENVTRREISVHSQSLGHIIV